MKTKVKPRVGDRVSCPWDMQGRIEGEVVQLFEATRSVKVLLDVHGVKHHRWFPTADVEPVEDDD